MAAAGGAPVPGLGLNQCVTKVELTVSCEHLLDMDVFSKSDPLCAMYTNPTGAQWYEAVCCPAYPTPHWGIFWEENRNGFGRTEMVLNCLNPKFSKKFVMDYYFEMVQKLKFCLYDIDSNSHDLGEADFLGELECTLGQIVSCKRLTRPLQMKDKSSAGRGTITICADEITDNRVANFEVFARKLDKKYLWWSDPFLEIYKKKENKWQLAYRTEVVKSNLNPIWKPFKIPLQSLCDGDMERPIKLFTKGHLPDKLDVCVYALFPEELERQEDPSHVKVLCYDHHENGSHSLIGEFETTLPLMQEGTHLSPAEFQCVNRKKLHKKRGYTNSGVIGIKQCLVVKEYTFLDYIMGGTQLNFTIAIDFTGSNGDPRTPQSLHYINPEGYNEYLTAIWAVGSVIQDYDSNKMFPVFGFGAQIPPTWHVSHEFPINFDSSNPFCAGIEGVVAAYQQCLPQVKLFGPTNFAPVINHAAIFARQALQQNSASQYYVLLILTDGVITDMDQTRTAVVEASRLPMSIIIIGVGDADFEAMEFLDSDDKILYSPSGHPALRDIVQFVPFRQFQVNKLDMMANRQALAQSVLAELPDQVSSFFNLYKLKPPNETSSVFSTPK